MTGRLLLRGMLVGVVAELFSFGFLKLAGEPSVDRAIAFETAMDEAKAKAKADEAEVCPFPSNRPSQNSSVGLFRPVSDG
jgi:hypothetical protein